ncbi:sensor histidine kinase [Rhizobium sp. SGZ-381]|uniref:sensor histidine kinase n=1 Tax=Rhizobium sp. SGZ-381 TaxID=3342800 RepID=UPI003672DCD6
MRVFNSIGARAIQGLDHLALGWLQQVGDRDAPRASDVTTLRVVAGAGIACLIAVPSTLALVVSPALALPLGAAVVVAGMLSASAAALALSRLCRSEPADGAAEPTDFSDLVFEACPGVVFACDPQGSILRTGGRDRYLLPSALSERQGLVLAELVHVSDRITVLQALDSLRQGEASAVADVRIEQGICPIGGRQFLAVRLDLSPIAGSDGCLQQVLVQLTDMSEEQCLRDEVEACAIEVQSANEAKSRFLAAVSHEMRTPLNAILGFSDVLAGEYFGRLENDRQREYVALIRQSGAHLLSVVNTMLDMSRIEAGRYALLTEPFRIADAVESCRAMLDLQARTKGVTLATRIARGLGDVVADRRAVQQILINLAGNAIKFTEAGGAVTIDALAEEGLLKLIVSDTGIGIASDKIELLGQPFMQVEGSLARAYEGTGLGLSLVKGLVSLHGGQMRIESRLGEGTVVTVSFPLDGKPADERPLDGADAPDGLPRSVEPLEFPPRLRQPAKGSVTGRQGLAHDRAKAKTG